MPFSLPDRPLRRVRFFADTADLERARRATDVILLVGSLLGLLLIGLAAVPEPGFIGAITSFVGALPVALQGTWQSLADLPVLWGLVILAFAMSRSRKRVARDMVFAAAAATVLWFVISRIVEGSWPEARALFGDVAPPVVFPAPRLGIPASLLITASPHLVRPMRRVGYAVIGLGSFAAVALGASSTLGVVAALLSAGLAAAAVHLMVGSSAGRPSLDDVAFALADMNVAVGQLGVADRQDAGVFVVEARAEDGSDILVKVYGRDAHDAALVSAVWRTIWLRQPGSPVGLRRLRQVEHEALMTLLAAQASIPTDTVITAGATRTDDAVLVLRLVGVPLVERDRFVGATEAPAPAFDASEVDGRLHELWNLVTTLHDGNMAHGQLDEDHLVVVDGRLGLNGFRGATVAPTAAQLAQDDAQMFVTTVGLVGPDAATSGLLVHRSPDEIERMLPYLQPTALTNDQRRLLKVLDADLDDFRAHVAQEVDLDAPPLVALRRFTVGSVLRIALPVFAVFMLISAFAGFDLPEFLESLQDAVWWLVAAGFVVAQLPRIAQAVSTLGAAPIPLPLGPVYALQLAISYVNLAIPTAASRIAVNVRFFQRQGVSPTQAMATGALDGVSGFIVQAMLLGSLLLFSSLSLDVDVSGPASAAVRVITVVAIIAAVILAVVVVIPRLRRYVFGAVRNTGREAMHVLRGLRSPRRAVMLFGGNLTAELLFALALGTFVLAFGFSVPLHELLFINMAVSLVAGLLPIPGGVGVTEGGLILGLTSFGVSQEAAFAAVILYRFSTFYLPPIWGFFSLRWLERNRFL
jgi:uncharacterized membrane protein YbhN (UPF0104 family)